MNSLQLQLEDSSNITHHASNITQRTTKNSINHTTHLTIKKVPAHHQHLSKIIYPKNYLPAGAVSASAGASATGACGAAFGALAALISLTSTSKRNTLFEGIFGGLPALP
jgi:hypothetical protein